MSLKKEQVSVIIAIICISTITGLTATNVIRFSDLSSAIAYVLVAGTIGVLAWGFRSRILHENITKEVKKSNHESEFRLEKSKEPVEDRPKQLSHKKIRLRVEEYDDLKLNLKKGNQITGKISSDGFFNVYFLTESSFKSFKNDYNFQYLGGSEDVSHFEPQFEAPRRDTFHIVFENADKKNIIVNVELYQN